MRTVYAEIKFFAFAAIAQSAFAVVIGLRNTGSVWAVICLTSLGQGIGILGFVMSRDRKMFTKTQLAALWRTQKNTHAVRWRDRNLFWHILAGRTGVPIFTLGILWADPAIISALGGTGVCVFLLMRRFNRDEATPQTTMALGGVGWLIAAGTASGGAMIVFAEAGRIDLSSLASLGVLAALLGQVLDYHNVERSVKLIEISAPPRLAGCFRGLSRQADAICS